MTPQWTALFYTYAEDDETKKYAGDLENLLYRIPHTEAFNLLLFRSQYFHSSNRIHGELYLLRSEPGSEYRQLISIKYFPAVNPGESALLSDVLRTIKENNLLQGKFLFFPWDHGTGFGIFNWNPFQEKGMKASPAQMEVIRSRPKMGIAGGMKLNEGFDSFNEININMLTMTEINEALKVIGSSTPIVIIMLNCWTQMLETGYEFSDTVEWLVAPETVHYFKGYDYKSILQAIADTPDINTERVAQVAIESLYSFFHADAASRAMLDNLVVSAVRPSRSNAVVNALIDISMHHLEHSLPGTFEKIAYVRKTCNDVSSMNGNPGWKFIDLLHFVKLLNTGNLVGAAFYDRMHTAMNDYVRYIHPGSNNLTDISTYGCSVYHPQEEPDFHQKLYFSAFFEREIIKLARAGNYSWTNYLRKYKPGH